MNPRGRFLVAAASSLRPGQWPKNLLVFVPLAFGGRLFEPRPVLRCLAAFVILSLAAGAAYLFNDAVDREEDRVHPVKKDRPVAAGELGPSAAAVLAVLAAVAALGASLAVSASFAGCVSAYLLLNGAYSLFLRRIVLVDIACIMAFYLLRVLAGAAAAGVEPSRWLVSMIMVLALMMGASKRRQELSFATADPGRQRRVLSRYDPAVLDRMIAVLAAVSIAVFALYTVSAETVARFGTHRLLWTSPIVCYGILRYLRVAREKKTDDPTRVLTTDRPVMAAIILWMAACVAIIYRGRL